MSDRTCSIDGCERPVMVKSRGWCSLHYHRWWRYGTFDAPKRKRRPPVSCSVVGCSRPALARTWCDKHYWRWSKYGSLQVPGGDPPAGMKWCRKCQTYKSLDEFNTRRAGKPSSPCKLCTLAIASAQSRRRRAVKRRAASESYTPEGIAKRDGWKCQICRKRINPRWRWPHPRSLSIDHIVPISKGGDDVKSNVQAAHLHCNMSKSVAGCDQLRLIG